MPPMGRPTKLTQIVRIRPDGTEITAADQIVERIQLGLDRKAAADSCGIARSTLHKWTVDGARLRALQAQKRLLKPRVGEVALIEFSDALEKAEANAELSRLGIISQVAKGGYLKAKVTRKYERHAVRDAKGQPTGQFQEVEVERVEVEETAAPNWQAAAWYLERKRGYVRRFEVTGAGGDPLIPSADRAEALAESLADFQAGVEAAKQVAAKATKARAAARKRAKKAPAKKRGATKAKAKRKPAAKKTAAKARA